MVDWRAPRWGPGDHAVWLWGSGLDSGTAIVDLKNGTYHIATDWHPTETVIAGPFDSLEAAKAAYLLLID